MLFGNQPFIADMTTFALRHPSTTAATMRRDYKRRAALFTDRLGAIPGLKPHLPKSGMFILADVGGTGLDGEAFAWALLDAGVAVMPGSSFGDNAKNLIRLSLTVPDEAIERACTRIAHFVETLP